ncbi:MAG: hypothetical protein IID12_07680 [Candidatus Marinimicrobia bacterium]|nr:hypothetical protein [Candidatus Neomarinimicrobiota bacterium]
MNKSDWDNCNFSHAHYKACLQNALENGYEFLKMNDVEVKRNKEKTIVMRHDEDLSLPAMHYLAEIEGELGINSTYFVRLHAKNYNLLSYDSYTSLHEIIKMGHEIGFHYELHCHPELSSREEEIFTNSKSLLESILGIEITGMSYHEPSRSMKSDEKRPLPPGIEYEAYEDKFMKNHKYISDSSAHWREGCMCRHINKEDNLYILTHGFWWFKESPAENY